MDYLVKNMGARFPGLGEGSKGGSSSRRERKIPVLQRTQSFKGERKGLSWIRRQFISRMSRGSDVEDDDPEYATAVAAAAYAITSMEETRTPDQKKKSEGPESSPTRVMSKKSAMGDSDGVSSRVPAPNLESGEISVGISEGKPEGKTPPPPPPPPPAPRLRPPPPPPPSSLPKTKTQKPAIAPAASLKEAPTDKPPAAAASSTNKPLNTAASRKQPVAAPKPPPPLPPPPPPPPPPPIKGTASQKDRTTKGRPIGEIEIDAWEKAEMAKIKEKFDKLNGEIASWAEKKKNKAKRKLDKTEAALDQERAKALKHYRTDIQNIDYVAGGARAQADEKRRNDELKVKEKARMIRETGQLPRTCFCF